MARSTIFLSYHHPDEATARDMERALTGRGFDCFFAPWGLQPGAFWFPELACAIESCDAFVLLVNGAPGAWQLIEYYEAFDRKVRDSRFPVIPVLLSVLTHACLFFGSSIGYPLTTLPRHQLSRPSWRQSPPAAHNGRASRGV